MGGQKQGAFPAVLVWPLAGAWGCWHVGDPGQTGGSCGGPQGSIGTMCPWGQTAYRKAARVPPQQVEVQCGLSPRLSWTLQTWNGEMFLGNIPGAEKLSPQSQTRSSEMRNQDRVPQGLPVAAGPRLFPILGVTTVPFLLPRSSHFSLSSKAAIVSQCLLLEGGRGAGVRLWDTCLLPVTNQKSLGWQKASGSALCSRGTLSLPPQEPPLSPTSALS